MTELKDAMHHRLTIENMREAARVIDPVFLNTPQYHADSLSKLLGARLIVKVETANPIRSFKGRGAEYLTSKVAEGTELITASAGNFGQAMAYACSRQKLQLGVYASVNANPFKLERTRMLGATVVLHGEDFDEAKIEAKRVAFATGKRLVEDGFDAETGEGAGTIGIELAAWKERIDVVLLPLGNGALACGVGRYLKEARPEIRVVAVQSAGAPAMLESWRRKEVVRFDSISTIADGIGVRIPIPECVRDMEGVIDDGILVKDASLIEAIRLAHEHLGVVLEPSGAAGLAAILENRDRFADQSVAVVLCGGNLTPEQMKLWL
ncbi:MAG TPA: pyridoxal-phosphate dependent enzyme [Chthoniobacterales bacterium]|nr:pyridoxal-phosphate dependent enzyme [Chthoniobacterales bacterium]